MDFIKALVSFLQGLFVALTEFIGKSIPVMSGMSNVNIPGLTDDDKKD